MALNPLKIDPTRTTLLRRQLMTQMRRRLARLRKAIKELVEIEDAFGLRARRAPVGMPVGAAKAATVRTQSTDLALNTRWQFETDDAKLDAYRTWLQQQVAAGILEVDPANRDTPWLEPYIRSAYKKGLLRAYTDTRRAAIAADRENFDFIEGGQKAFLDMAFNSPTAEGKIRMLATRSFAQLEGVTAQMDQEMSRILAQGMANGTGPRALARELSRDVSSLERKRALTIARTEIVHAHNEGQLDAFEALDIEDVGVMAEWNTAHDGKVCALCRPLEGVVLKIKEARGMLPRHPNCRCAWLPANVGEHEEGTTKTTFAGPEQGLEAPGTAPTGDTVGQTFSKDEIDSKIRESVKREKPRAGSVKVARAQSTWPGADTKIDKQRPKRPKTTGKSTTTTQPPGIVPTSPPAGTGGKRVSTPKQGAKSATGGKQAKGKTAKPATTTTSTTTSTTTTTTPAPVAPLDPRVAKHRANAISSDSGQGLAQAGVELNFVEGSGAVDIDTMDRILKARGVRGGWADLTKGEQDKLTALRTGKSQLDRLTGRLGNLGIRAKAKKELGEDGLLAAAKAARSNRLGAEAAKVKPVPKWKPVKNAKEFEAQAAKHFPGLRNVTVDFEQAGRGYTIKELNEIGEDMARMYREHPRMAQYFEMDTRSANYTFGEKVVRQGRVRENANGTYFHGRSGSDIYATPQRGRPNQGGGGSNGRLGIGSRHWVTESGANGTVRHEFGHYVHYRIDLDPADRMLDLQEVLDMPLPGDWDKVLKKIGGGENSRQWKEAVSKYGGTNDREMFAESYATWTHRDYGKPGEPRLPKVIEEYMSRLTGAPIP